MILLFGLLLVRSGMAQDYQTKIKKLTVEDGLNGQIKQSVLLDSYGFLWLSSSYGLDQSKTGGL